MVSTPLDGTTAAYPQADIDPRDKDFKWILQYTRSAYNDGRGYLGFGSLNNGNLKMSEIKVYGLGKQPVDKYKKIFSPGSPDDPSWRAVDWTPPAFMSKYREIGISKILQRNYDIQAYIVDPLAKSQEDEFFNKMKVKMLMRETAQQAGSDLVNSPELSAQQGEPQDMEQLAMQKEFGYKHVMAMEAENAVNLIHTQNNFEEKRKRTATNLYDFGIAGYTQWIDENGMVKEREIDPEYLGLSYCEKPDFSDLVHWFEIVPTYVGDLAPYYTKEQLDDICQKALGKNGNPIGYTPFNGYFNSAWNRFKIFVVHIKFLSWNETVYKDEVDGRGNMRFNKTEFENRKYLSVSKEGQLSEGGYHAPLDETKNEGAASAQYMNEVKKVVYKASWIMETDYMHNYGLQENQNRKLSSWWDTDLGIQLYAWNFYKMRFTGITERLIPLEDKACMTWFNLQNLSNKLIPYLINIDFNAVEAVNFGKGGQKQKPSQIIDFIFSNFVVPYRSTDLLSRNPNYKPVSIEATGQLAAFGQLYEDLQNTIEMMRQISGLNELTDGSTPNAKTLVPVADAAVQSTNNSLYLISMADRNLIERSADAIVQKVQIAVKLGKVDGYSKALGDTTVQFLQINPDISLHELGICLKDVPSDAQREQLWAEVTGKEQQGLVTVADKMIVMSTRNLTEAGMILDYKINKRKQEAQQYELQKIQKAAEDNAMVAQRTEQMKQQTIEVQLQADLIRIQTESEWTYRIEAMKKSADVHGETIQSEARTIGHAIQAQAKINASHIAAEATKEKQEIANKKPVPKKSA